MKINRLQSPYIRRKHDLALLIAILLALIAFSAGCVRDPNIRKQKALEQGNREFDKGRYPEALIYYGRALQIDPHSADAHYRIARCQLKLASWSAAYRELMRTVDLEPANTAAQMDLAELQLAGGKAQDAKDRALLVLSSNPKHVEAQVLLSTADAALGNQKSAVQEARDAAEMAPDRAMVFLHLGSILAKGGALADAEANFKKAKSLDSVSITPLVTLGNFYEQQKRWTEAGKEFEAAIAREPRNPIPRAALATLYMRQGQDSSAEKVLTDAKKQLNDVSAGYRMLGDYYLGRGENAKAFAEFDVLAKEHPTDFQVRKTYIQLLILNRRIDEAAQLDDDLLKKSPQDAEGLILKGQIQLQRKKVDDSIQTLQQALKISSDNALGHYQLGVAFHEKGNVQQAEGQWHEAVRLRPALAEAWRALGNTAIQRADWPTVTSIADQLKKIAPRSPDGYLLEATARVNNNDAKGAERELQQIIQMAPQNAIGYVKLAQLRSVQKRFTDAQTLYQKGLNLELSSMDAVQGLVEVYFRLDKPTDAMRLLETQLQLHPDSAALYLLQAQAFLQRKQFDDAEHSLQRTLEIDKQNVRALMLLAQIQASRGSLDQTIATYRRVVEVAPNNISGYVALGSAYEATSNWQQAESIYQKALAIQPENALAANNLAYLMLEHGGSVNVALNLAQTARRGLPDLPNSADTLGWAYYHNGAYSVAAPLLEEAVSKIPANVNFRYHLGMTYQKLDDKSRARAQFEKIISLKPDSPVAGEARQALSQISGS